MSLPRFDVQGSLFESLGSIAADLALVSSISRSKGEGKQKKDWVGYKVQVAETVALWLWTQSITSTTSMIPPVYKAQGQLHAR